MDQNAQPQQDAMQTLADSVAKLTQQSKVSGSSEAAQDLTARIFERIAQALTAQDMEKVQELDKNDATGDTVKYFLMTKVPNLEAIIQEEIDAYKKSMGSLPNRGGDTT